MAVACVVATPGTPDNEGPRSDAEAREGVRVASQPLCTFGEVSRGWADNVSRVPPDSASLRGPSRPFADHLFRPYLIPIPAATSAACSDTDRSLRTCAHWSAESVHARNS